jgi:uncharacterized protein (DUF885 family)
MSNPSRQFEGILSHHFEAELADDPVAANFAGLREGEGRLGAAGPQHEERRQRRRLRTLRELEALCPRELTSEQHLDRLALRSHLLRGVEDYARGRHALDPDAINHVLNVLFHELERGHDEPKRAAGNLRSLLRQVPDYLAEAAGLIRQPEAVWLNVMRETAAGAASLLEATATFLGRHQSHESDRAAIRSTGRAIEKYCHRIAGRPVAPGGSFAIGREQVERRVRDELGLDYTLGQIEALAESEVRRIGGLLQKACARFGRGKSAAEILNRARSEWNPRGDLFSIYQKETERIAAAFKAARAVTFPAGESLVLRPAPDFMKPLLPTAAYSAPGAFAKRQRGIFWVNDLSLDRKTEAEKRRERQQHFGVALTCAHEAYPGHHLQFATANRHPRKWRRLFSHAVFYEGWTLWCEQMTVNLRIDRSPWTLVQQLKDALWRCHRILIDLRLQTGRYTYEQGVRHLQTHLQFSRARARAEINWYSGSPCVPMSYWLGRLENERLYQRLVVGRGWSLQRFNDWLLSFGTLPQAWLEKYGLD